MENLLFLETLKNLDWNVCLEKQPNVYCIVDLANGRIRDTTEEFREFISSFSVCSNKEDTIWFLSVRDYQNREDDCFAWNEFERQSLEFSENDDERHNVTEFWEAHLPFLMSVKNGYEYVAIGIAKHNFGNIYRGYEPMYEEPILIANSFSEFKRQYILSINK
ncbi:SMI1/KNR4 family protein [Capnocytophaga sp. oral taxon 878]|uniref:SMI1/KNR4 family protein n=1 Tax=Capnocytophaga sp. oral taxon 878 TaxID=1316596 RepID=UPI000D03E598|nr:SMI1/KNR4 family protein [Capnocytophaga sp. oral taxon 878]AVM49756.1 SMI1/KNR4 family protein [Capnocytophaga sp. oral taxon 878]